ncbi:hypothetical protein J6590_013943 [Homalodisca vitripennis]|nr:hypothetical protein J6590_013943 [Homalodisca vitripennis]
MSASLSSALGLVARVKREASRNKATMSPLYRYRAAALYRTKRQQLVEDSNQTSLPSHIVSTGVKREEEGVVLQRGGFPISFQLVSQDIFTPTNFSTLPAHHPLLSSYHLSICAKFRDVGAGEYISHPAVERKPQRTGLCGGVVGGGCGNQVCNKGEGEGEGEGLSPPYSSPRPDHTGRVYSTSADISSSVFDPDISTLRRWLFHIRARIEIVFSPGNICLASLNGK